MDYAKTWNLLDYVFMGFFTMLAILNIVTFLQKESFTTNQLLLLIFNCCICALMISICLSSIFKKTSLRCVIYFVGAILCVVKMGVLEEPDTMMRVITGLLTMVFTMGGTLTLVYSAVQKLRRELESKIEQPKIIKP